MKLRRWKRHREKEMGQLGFNPNHLRVGHIEQDKDSTARPVGLACTLRENYVDSF